MGRETTHVTPPATERPSAARRDAPAILSAQLASPGPIHGSADEGFTVHHRLYVVFNTEIDPASLWPSRFIVMLDNGARVAPYRATLSPANEDDENRTVALDVVAEVTPPEDDALANAAPKDPQAPEDAPPPSPSRGRAPQDDGDPRALLAERRRAAWLAARDETRPRSVALAGPLHAESGVVIEELSSAITGPDSPVRLTLALRLPPQHGPCPAATQVIRTYWSTPVSAAPQATGTTPAVHATRERIWLRLGDGRRVHPSELDDHGEPTLEDPTSPTSKTPAKAEATGDDAPDPRVAVMALAKPRSARDDNVVDLCLREHVAVTHLEIASGTFVGEGTPANEAVVDLALGSPAPRPPVDPRAPVQPTPARPAAARE